MIPLSIQSVAIFFNAMAYAMCPRFLLLAPSE